MPRTHSANCHMISGRSGDPKLRQSVIAIGRPPLSAMLRAASAFAADDGGVAPFRTRDRVRAHGRVVLLPDPSLRAEIRRGDQAEKVVRQVAIVNTLTI